MLGLADKALAMIGGGGCIVLAGALAFTVISKNATIGELRDDKKELTTKVDTLNSSLTQCRANRITLEEATRRQNAAVTAAKAESAGRLASLATAVDRAETDAERARREAARIMARPRTGDACRDADALILEEAGA